jgi:putative type II restriction enzyme (methylase subunit)
MGATLVEKIEGRLAGPLSHDPWGFLASFLDIFGFPKATFERLRIKRDPEGYSYAEVTNKIFFSVNEDEDLSATLGLSKSHLVSGKSFRFYVSVNGEQIAAYDSERDLHLKCFIRELRAHYAFFLPLLGIESGSPVAGLALDESISAGFASLANQIKLNKNNKEKDYDSFILRFLLICLLDGFIENRDNSFANLLKSHFDSKGSETRRFLQILDRAISSEDRSSYPNFTQEIPFFDELDPLEDAQWPNINSKAHQLIEDLLQRDWAKVTPDVIGAVVQAAISSADKDLPFNYTSALYVSRLSSPLFLKQYRKELSDKKDDIDSLMTLLANIQAISLFDPSCGVGSVLSMVYSDLKQLEKDVIRAIAKLDNRYRVVETCCLKNVTGLERDGAKVSASCITLALVDIGFEKDRTLKSFRNSFAEAKQRIHQGDPLLSDWNNIQPNTGSVFIVTNPEYRGSRRMDARQKQGRDYVFKGAPKTKDLDYSAGWIMKGAQYIAGTASKAALFATNSITQGDQVSALWSLVFNQGVEISFAHKAFKWKTAAQNTNAVTVVAIGLSSADYPTNKTINDGVRSVSVDCIGPYLTPNMCFVKNSNKPLGHGFPKMPKGNMPYDHGYLMMYAAEKDEFVAKYPESEKYLKRVIGGDEFINDIERWCVWTPDKNTADEAISIEGIKSIYDKVREWRMTTTASDGLKNEPYRFRETLETKSFSLVIPNLSSENYAYIPMGFIDSGTIATNLLFVLYDCDILMFGILSSRMHNLWARSVGGGYETRIRYSNRLVYNTFPMPSITEEQQQKIRRCALDVLAERERYYEISLAKLYGDLPASLAAAHRTLDLVVDDCFQERPFTGDTERLDVLFSLYEKAKR